MAGVDRRTATEELADLPRSAGGPLLDALTVAIYLEDVLAVVLADDVLTSGALSDPSGIDAVFAGAGDP